MARCQEFALEERKGPETRLERGEGRGVENKAPCCVGLDLLLFEAAANLPQFPSPASHFCPLPCCLLWACPQRLIVEERARRQKTWLLFLFGCSVMSDSFCDPVDCSLPAPLSMGFSRQEYWSGMPFPSPGDLPDQRIEPASLESPVLAGRFFTTVPPGKPHLLQVNT